MLVLCTIPTTGGPYRWAVAEAARGLRPGGWLRRLEHVRTPFLPVRVLPGVLNPLPYSSKTTISCASLCGTSRNASLVVERLERSKLDILSGSSPQAIEADRRGR